MKKCVISLRTQSVNLGDFLILISSIDYLLTRYDTVYLDSKRVPSDFVMAVSKKYENEISKGCVVIKSLSLYFYVTSKFDFYRKAGAFFSRNDNVSKFNYILKSLFNRFRKFFRLGNAYLFPISITGKLNTFNEFFFRSFKHIHVRDQQSKKLLKDANIAQVTWVPDMSHYVIDRCRHSDNQSDGASTAVLSFRFDRHPDPSQVKEILNTICVEKSIVVSQVLYDTEFNLKLAAELRCEHVLAKVGFDGINDLVTVYSKCNFVISNRLHVLLLAMLSGATPIPLVNRNDHKVKDYFESLSYNCIDFDGSLSRDEILETYKINSAKLDLPEIRDRLIKSLDATIVP